MTLLEISEILKKNDEKGPTAYRSNLRSVIRGLWSTIEFNLDQGLSSFELMIRKSITSAWKEGAFQCGISMDELSPKESSALEQFIRNQNSFVFDFILDVEEKDKANGFPLSLHFKRIEKWVNQYPSAVMLASAMACADQKKMWVLGIAEHCNSCKKLAGKVKRNSFWLNKGILPRNAPNRNLECSGYECDCKLETTDLPLSRGPLPKLP